MFGKMFISPLASMTPDLDERATIAGICIVLGVLALYAAIFYGIEWLASRQYHRNHQNHQNHQSRKGRDA